MAKAPAVYALFCLIVLAQAVCASPRLPDGISDFVPDCAARCFRSFLEVNYQGTRCGSRESLRCFCTTRGNTGFTLGEGALQCIAVEGRFGGCSQHAARQAMIDEAYYMCSGQPGAISPTHEVITASLLLPTSSGDAVLFPPLMTTKDEPERPTSLPTTLLTDTSAFPEPVPSSTESTTTRTVPTTLVSSTRTSDGGVPTETGTGAAPLPAPTEGDEGSASGDDDGDDEPPTLGTAQVAGISVGVVAAAGVAIGAIFLARYFRRRRNPNVKTGFLPRRSTWGYNLNSVSSTTVSDGNSLVMTRAQIPEPGTVPLPPAYGGTTYSRASWKPEAIGLALSPGQQKKDAAGPISPARRLSKLLPAKPVMPPLFARRDSPRGEEDAKRESGPAEPRRNDAPPQLPPFVGLSIQQPADSSLEKPCPPSPLRIQIPKDNTKATTAPGNGTRARESTMTEFEEDDGPSSLSPEGQIWRPPSSTPFAASPYYVADKNGNWVLADSGKAMVAELPATTPPPPEPKSAPASKPKKLAAFLAGSKSVSGPHGSASQGGSAPRRSQTPAVIITPTHGPPSSLYSPLSSAPLPLFHPSSADQRSSGPSRPSTYLGRSDNRTSSQSSGITLFENSSDESKEPTPPEMRGSLSPVAESPPSAKGRSPVEYPQIAGRGRNNSVTRPNQPPPTRSPVYYPPGQPSPTLGMLSQQNQPPAGMSSCNVPTKGRQPVQHPAMARTGSPTTMRVVEPSPEPDDDRGRLPSSRPRYSQASSQPPHQPHVQPSPYQRQGQVQQLPPRAPQQRQGPPPEAFYIRGHYPPTGPSVYSQEHQMPPQTTSDNGPSPHTGPSPYRGENQMPLPPDPSNRPKPQRFPHHPPEHAAAGRQPRLDTMSIPLLLPSSTNQHLSPVSEASTSSSLLAKRLGSDRAAQMTLAEPGGSSRAKWRREGPSGQQQDLPSTPGWRPKLTPTRRGDDLFLNVQ
ncbi:hypothetical protein ACRE_033230 [Hapsidospora chrysogenum ATCC 11550]|uniref:Extracellular membrane protein CFEM domain-containing protein n=1 Tax=Hapsidospora chrysogenum (strain ATCC 11550 / CBS 779.69 / DSM 880 / IAM 14645 / JCM 23072 / IMI 49137) TaxID=857340 RepID=A0A086T904_HAPC1|nr:hypothetical protein ACRE_033230 [Hapsidospora chrysogenum ATCC 11550]